MLYSYNSHTARMPPRRSITLLLTGAPCSGKSTLAGLIEQHLAETDARVVVVRETATARILGSDATVTPIEFQRRVLDDQVRAEGEAHETAAALNTAGHDVLCVLDRGRRDGKLFCDPSTWEAIDGDRVSDGGQYDIVAHLTSMAIDAPAVYDTAQRQGQNPARTHTREQSALRRRWWRWRLRRLRRLRVIVLHVALVAGRHPIRHTATAVAAGSG